MVTLARHLRRVVPAPLTRADLTVFRAVSRVHAPVLDATLPRLSRAANHSLLWLGIGALLAGRGGRFGRRAALRGALAVAASSAITNLPAKLLTDRARPDSANVPLARQLARVPTSTSFPSGHSASAAAFATAVSMELPRARWPLALLATSVAFSRVYTGVHYPADVLVGAAIGIGVARSTRRAFPLAEQAPARGHAVDAPVRVGPDGEGLVIVANGQAGPALLPGPAARLASNLPAAEIIEVQDPDDFQAALDDACRRARVLGVAGGDGSVSSAAAAAHKAGLPLLVVPAGTLNHLASDLGFETVDDAINAVRNGDMIATDLAEIDGRPFVNAASIGVYPHLVDAREEREARIGKWPAVLLGLARLLRTGAPADVELDGRRCRIWLLFAGNCRYSKPGVAPTRRQRLDDGLLDVRIIHADLPWSRLRVFASTLLGRLGRSGPYEELRVSELRVRSLQGPLRLACDGESFDGSTEFTVRKRDKALQLLVPPAAKLE